MSEYQFVPAAAHERGEIASYLLALAEEKGYDSRVVRTVLRGFSVPAELLELEDGEKAIDLPEIPVVVENSGYVKEPPAWYTEDTQRPVDIEPDEEGNLVLKDYSYADIRAWAVANDVAVSKRGKIATEVINAYLDAQGHAE